MFFAIVALRNCKWILIHYSSMLSQELSESIKETASVFLLREMDPYICSRDRSINSTRPVMDTINFSWTISSRMVQNLKDGSLHSHEE